MVSTAHVELEPPPRPERDGVLVVEDDAGVREALCDLLRHYGFRVRAAVDLAAAAEQLDRVPVLRLPACLPVDLHLPDGGGIQLLRRVRSGGTPIGIAVVTGSLDAELLAKVRRLHPDAVFRKPPDVPRLVAWVARCVEAGGPAAEPGPDADLPLAPSRAPHVHGPPN